MGTKRTIMTIALSNPSRSGTVALWIAQALLAGFYTGVGFMKLSQPIPDLAAMMYWPGIVPLAFVRFVGAAELAGAAGLLLPLAIGILPRLTPLAATGLVLLQICAIGYHVSRGEFTVLALNLVLVLIAAFIAWGRRDQWG